MSTDKELKLPFYAKAIIGLIGLFVFLTMLYIAQSIIIPLIFAIIISVVLHPFVNFFVRIKINRIIAIVITLFIAFLIIAAFGTLIISQANRFGESWPKFVDRFTELLNETIIWISGFLNIRTKEIIEWIAKTKGELFNTNGAEIGQTIVG